MLRFSQTCIAAALGMASAAMAQTVTLHVAATGDDANPGTAGAPFATLARARDALRAMRPLPPGGASVLIQAGTYEQQQSFALTAEDAGTAESPIVYRAASGAEVRLTGAYTVPASAFAPVDAPAVLARLDPTARLAVRVADLAALGIQPPPPLPARFRGPTPVPELFVNDRRMALARWPNQGWTTIARIIEAGSNPRNGDNSNRPGAFEYAGDRPQRWDVDAGVWLQGYWCFDWFEEVLQVKAIDTQTRRIGFFQPHYYSIKQGNPSPRRYRALNLLEELDEPGEYFIDRVGNRLYLWPPDDLAAARIALAHLHDPVVALTEAAHVAIEGLIVEAGMGHGIAVNGGSDCSIVGCTVRNLRQLGISVNGGFRHRVQSCTIHDTGTGGLTLAGGDRRTLTAAGHEAVNNHIHHFAQHQLTYANGLSLSGVGNRAVHNLLHDAPHQAVGVSGNDHVFELNIVHNVCLETDDCGAYYKGRNPSCRGNIVRHNFWHHIGGPMGHGNAAVYFDDGDGGDMVIGNVFFRCGDPGKGNFATVFSHGGHDLLAENNIFIECKRALGSSPWNDKRWKDYINAELWQTRLLQEVDITKPPYTERYPALVGFMDPQPGLPRVSRAVRNVIAMGADVKTGNWQVDEADNWVTDSDPGFVDPAKGDFRLRPDSPVFTRLPGFAPIPFEKMGLYVDAWRPRVEREWAYEAPKPLPPLAQIRAARAAAAAPAGPPKGPAPVFTARQAPVPIAVDGHLLPAEWPLSDLSSTMVLAQDLHGNPAPRQSRAWIAWDATSLYVAIDNTVALGSSLAGNVWGSNDAVEISLRDARAGTGIPITVIRGFGNGFLQFGTTPAPDQEPNAMDPGGCRYKAAIPEDGRWVAEFAIPFAMLNLEPVAGSRLAFNLTVRKAKDDLWLMWEGTRGNSYNVAAAGIVELGL